MVSIPFIPENITRYVSNENILLFIIVLFVIFFIYLVLQIGRYKNLRKWLKSNLEETKRQEEMIKTIGADIDKYKKSQEGLDYWSNIKEELVELSKLPSLREEENEFILKVQISKLKKDNIDVIANGQEININIYEGEVPLKSTYHLPKAIDPNRILISYKGNTLEIRAQKI